MCSYSSFFVLFVTIAIVKAVYCRQSLFMSNTFFSFHETCVHPSSGRACSASHWTVYYPLGEAVVNVSHTCATSCAAVSHRRWTPCSTWPSSVTAAAVRTLPAACATVLSVTSACRLPSAWTWPWKSLKCSTTDQSHHKQTHIFRHVQMLMVCWSTVEKQTCVPEKTLWTWRVNSLIQLSHRMGDIRRGKRWMILWRGIGESRKRADHRH